MSNLKKETLEITEIWANRVNWHDYNPEYEDKEQQVLGIDWVCNLGLGRYELFFEEDGTKIKATSEFMDTNEDKSFLRALLDKVADMAEIIE